MIHDHVVMIHYEKYDQKLHIEICKSVVLNTAQPSTCFGYLLWRSSGRCRMYYIERHNNFIDKYNALICE
jgi:hypothetical protein